MSGRYFFEEGTLAVLAVLDFNKKGRKQRTIFVQDKRTNLKKLRGLMRRLFQFQLFVQGPTHIPLLHVIRASNACDAMSFMAMALHNDNPRRALITTPDLIPSIHPSIQLSIQASGPPRASIKPHATTTRNPYPKTHRLKLQPAAVPKRPHTPSSTRSKKHTLHANARSI